MGGYSWMVCTSEPICTHACSATMLARGLNARTASLATIALDIPTCWGRNKNCRFRFDGSIVSRSMVSMSMKPESTRFFSSSQPIPPAPTTRTFDDSMRATSGPDRADASMAYCLFLCVFLWIDGFFCFARLKLTVQTTPTRTRSQCHSLAGWQLAVPLDPAVRHWHDYCTTQYPRACDIY
jgi:hypothetical protein